MTDKEIFFEVLHKARELKAMGDEYNVGKRKRMFIVKSYTLGYYEALHRRDDE